MKRLRWWGWCWSTAAVASLVPVQVGCGERFRGKLDDCRVTHTCEATAGASGGPSGAEGLGGQGGRGFIGDDGGSGAGVSRQCDDDANCDDGDAHNGVERCVASSCVAGNPPPSVVSVTPSDGAVDVDLNVKVALEVSESLVAESVSSESIKLLDGDRVVPAHVAYDGKRITVTPQEPLQLLTRYRVSVSTAVMSVDGAALVEPFESSFKLRDGEWHVTTIESGFVEIGPDLPLDSAGKALLGYAPRGDHASWMWFERGEQLGATATFGSGAASQVRASIASDGNAVVGWLDGAGKDSSFSIARFRDGDWAPFQRLNLRSGRGTALASPGAAHYALASSDGVHLWSTTPEGSWPTESVSIGASSCLTSPRMIADALGNVTLACRFEEADLSQGIAVARFSAGSGIWGRAEVIPGSLTTSTDPGNERGEPSIALDEAGTPMLLWQRGTSLVSSRYDEEQGGWALSREVASPLGLPSHDAQDRSLAESPALVFDGATFVAAFASLLGQTYEIYVSRFDRQANAWRQAEHLTDDATVGAKRFPRLVSDAHGNLLVVWAVASPAGVHGLAYRRFDADAGEWLPPKTLDSATMTNSGIDLGYGFYPLGGSPSGAAALAFTDGANGVTKNLRLASFF